MDLSILLPTYNEENNIGKLITEIRHVANTLSNEYEIIVMDGLSTDKTRENAKKAGAEVFIRTSTDFKTFLTEGIKKTKGKYIITMDSDFSNPPSYIKYLWNSRNDADIIICSKWVKGGGADMTFFRKKLSQFFNFVYRNVLSIKVHDLNCNYRLYHRRVLKNMKLIGVASTILPEIIFHASMDDYKIKEIPFFCPKRKYGKSKLKLLSYGKLYLQTLFTLWKIKMFNKN